MADDFSQLQCTECGCDIFLFPTGSGWDVAQRIYANCGWYIPKPLCGECLLSGIKGGTIAKEEAMSDTIIPPFPDWLLEEYSHWRDIPGQGWCAIHQYAYTYGLVCGITEIDWQHRYCFEHQHDALHALTTWDGEGDPPGPWIKHKPSDRMGPGLRE